MIETQNIQIAPGLVFDVSVAGPADGPLVLMLHGFGVSRYFWNAQVEALAQAGYRTAAPNQRGYAIGARPDPADYPSYRIGHLIADARPRRQRSAAPTADSISPATIGVAASPGTSPTGTPNASPP